RLLEASTMKSRRGFAIQRLMNAMRQAHADGWFIVFDTLTLADDRLEAFYDNPNALSFRMQGVEFDNGDMYVDGHKAASDVRDEFVSVTEKLMDELAQCYNVLPQLDINNTIDHRPEG